MSKYKKCFLYSGSHQHDDDYLDTLFSSVKSHDSNTTVKIIVGTKTVLMDVYAIVSKSGVNIAKVFQDRFYKCGIPIKIWSNNSQEDFMGIGQKLIRSYGVGSEQSEAHKQNQEPAVRQIQEIKGTNCTVLNHSESSSWYWFLCLACIVLIINWMYHILIWIHDRCRAPNGVWIMGKILILDDKTHFSNSRGVFV